MHPDIQPWDERDRPREAAQQHPSEKDKNWFQQQTFTARSIDDFTAAQQQHQRSSAERQRQGGEPDRSPQLQNARLDGLTEK